MNKVLLKDSLRYINSLLQFRWLNEEFPGCAIGVRLGNTQLLSRAYGLADIESQKSLTPQHSFRIASHSKTFTGTAIMQLVEQSELRLDDRVSEHLRWFRSTHDTRIAEITIRQLLSHSAGLFRDGMDCSFWHVLDDFPGKAKLKSIVQNSRAVFDANVQFKYSNIGYAVLGQVIESVSGLPYNEYVTQHILNVLGLKCTGPELDDQFTETCTKGYSANLFKMGRSPFPHIDTLALSSATGFYSTVEDLCTYGAAHFLGSKSLLCDSSKREMQRIQWLSKGNSDNYGLGFQVWDFKGRRLIGHSGGFPGYITKTAIDPIEKLVVTVLTNSADGPARAILDGIFASIHYFQRVGKEQGRLSKSELNRFTGRFFSRWGASDIIRVGRTLVATAPETWNPFTDVSVLQPKTKNSFRIECDNQYYSPGETVRFRFEKSGAVRSLFFGGSPLFPWGRYCKKFGITVAGAEKCPASY